MSLDDLEVSVVSRAGMIIMKQLGGRRKDLLDLELLTGNTDGLTPENWSVGSIPS